MAISYHSKVRTLKVKSKLKKLRCSMHNYHRLKEVFYRFVALLTLSTRIFECDAELFTDC